MAAPRLTRPARPWAGPGVAATAQRPEVPPATRWSLAPPRGAHPARSRSKSPSPSRLPGVGRTAGAVPAGAVVAVVAAAGAVVAVVAAAGAVVVAGPAA